MKTKEVTVERNFHIMNDDRFIMEKISMTAELDVDEREEYVINKLRQTIVENFKSAYPKVYTHLNFYEVVQVKQPVPKFYDGVQTITIEDEPKQWQEQIDKDFNLIDEINKCKTIRELKTFSLITVSDEEKRAYENKLQSFSPIANK